jgi:HK97 family phage major capsid protein
MAKDSQGRYILGDPGGNNPARLWGLPVVPTPAMSAETFLVLDGPAAAVILDREEARVDLSTEDGDNFTTNRVTIRAEERLGLATLRTGGLIKGMFGS